MTSSFFNKKIIASISTTVELMKFIIFNIQYLLYHHLFLQHEGGISKALQKMKVEIYDEKTCGKKFNNKHHICFGTPFGGACNVGINVILFLL